MPRIDWTRYEVHGTPQYMQVRIIIHLYHKIHLCMHTDYFRKPPHGHDEQALCCVRADEQTIPMVHEKNSGESHYRNLHLRRQMSVSYYRCPIAMNSNRDAFSVKIGASRYILLVHKRVAQLCHLFP